MDECKNCGGPTDSGSFPGYKHVGGELVEAELSIDRCRDCGAAYIEGQQVLGPEDERVDPDDA